jgi:hypothetical protein
MSALFSFLLPIKADRYLNAVRNKKNLMEAAQIRAMALMDINTKRR